MNSAVDLPPPYAPPVVEPFERDSFASYPTNPLPELKPFLASFASIVSDIAVFDGVESQLATQTEKVTQLEENLLKEQMQLDMVQDIIQKESKELHKLEHFSFKQLGSKIKGKAHYESQVNGAKAKLLEDKQRADMVSAELTSLREAFTAAGEQKAAVSCRQSELQQQRQRLESFLDKTFYSIHDPSVPVLDQEARLKQHVVRLEEANAKTVVLLSKFQEASKDIDSAKKLLNNAISNLDPALESEDPYTDDQGQFSAWNEFAIAHAAHEDATIAAKYVGRAKTNLPGGLPPSLDSYDVGGLSVFGVAHKSNLVTAIPNVQDLLPEIVARRDAVDRIALWIRGSIEAFSKDIAAKAETAKQTRRRLCELRVSLLREGMKEDGLKETELNWNLQLLCVS
ncbi:hypothetical protein BC830DRAFT_555765 [Chytriomyces sp. MP71]|nr:hypothetical protein BC830DRAFT_555765 [Chytriomyces sp. MP71]